MESKCPEALLIKAVLSREKSAFRNLIRRYEGLVIHIVVPLIKNEKDREDICQDVFLKVYEKLDTFGFKSKLSTWIGNIAYNMSINFLRKKKNVALEDILGTGDYNEYEKAYKPGDILKDDSPWPDEIIIQKENHRLLKDATDTLPVIQKTILLLFHQDEQSLEEIGAILEMPVNTIKSHLFRARFKLKELLYHHK